MALNKTVHKNIMIKILKDIFRDYSLGPILGFKGGTAAFLFYDLLDPEKEDSVFEGVRKVLERYGVVKDADKGGFNLSYTLSYEGKELGDQNIKVEINKRAFGSKYE